MTEFTVSRRRFNTLLGTGIVGGLAMPSLALGQSAREIRLAHHTALESEQQLTAEVFARKVAEYSGGSLKVTILPAAQMGGQREIIESVSLDVLEMGYGEGGIYSSYVPQFGIIALPYLYKDFDHWQRVVDGPIGADLAQRLEQNGNITLLNWLTGGYRNTFLRPKAIEKPADFAGIKIRLPEAPVFVRTFSHLGALPTPIPAPEMYSALQTGVVDAMEGSLEVGYTYKIYEVTKFLSMTQHILNDGSFAINTGFFDGLAAEQQEALTKAAAEAAVDQRANHFQRQQGWFDKLKSESPIAVNEPDLVPFQAALVPVQDEFAAASQATDLLAQIRAT